MIYFSTENMYFETHLLLVLHWVFTFRININIHLYDAAYYLTLNNNLKRITDLFAVMVLLH